MKENTLYDIIDKIEIIISDLSYFEESEALNVLALQEQLESIKKEIKKTVDLLKESSYLWVQ